MLAKVTEPGADSLRNPADPGRRIRAIVFDLDGTLYRQKPIQMMMAMELGLMVVRHPWRASRTIVALREYRRAQETLRGSPRGPAEQIAVASHRSGVPRPEVTALVQEWMLERPLKHLRRHRAPGIDPLFHLLEHRRIPAAVLSDYPADAKLHALGLRERISAVVCAGDDDVNVFKPDPRGFRVACARLGADPADVLMVGDRVDADGAGALAAGMPCVIVGRKESPPINRAGLIFVPSLERLHRVLDDDGR